MPSQNFGVVASLKRGIPVAGAILCPLCGGDGEDHNNLNDPGPCDECGGQGWLPDEIERDDEP